MKKLKRIFMGFAFLLPVLVACGSDDPIVDDGKEDDDTDHPVTEPSTPTYPENPAWWGTDRIAATLADSSFCYYNRAFLLHRDESEDGSIYYCEQEQSAHWAYYWNQALIILMVEDRYEFTEDEALKPLISELLYSFLEHEKNPATNDTYDWTWNDYTDDLLWAGLAFIRGYQITGDERFLKQAEWDWEFLYNRAYDDLLGGGLWWSVTKGNKSGLSNNPAVSMACYLYEATGNEEYLKRAKEIWEWISVTLLQPNGAVDENISREGKLTNSYNVYNVGAFIEACNALYQITRKDIYKETAMRCIQFVMTERVTDKGIMSDRRWDGSWQSEFARGMGMFVKDNNLWDYSAEYTKARKPITYYEWMKLNAEAAWDTRNSNYITWNEWAAPTLTVPDGAPKNRQVWTALEMVSAVVMTQVTPEKHP